MDSWEEGGELDSGIPWLRLRASEPQLQRLAEFPETGEVAQGHLAAHLLGRDAVVRVAGEVAVLHHAEPAFAIADQAHAKGEPERVARSDQIGVALRQQQIAQGIPAELEAILEGLDQTLALPLIQLGRLEEGFQLIEGLAEIGEALLPANVGRHGGGAIGAFWAVRRRGERVLNRRASRKETMYKGVKTATSV